MFSGQNALKSGVLRSGKSILAISLVFALTAFGVMGEDLAPGNSLSYTNSRVREVPWSIHVVRIDRSDRDIEIHSMHADQRAIGLARLTAQIALWNRTNGVPVAAVNGDFYQRDRAFAGDPRGLQIIEGELISAPTGGASFWVDAVGEPHADNISSAFQVFWPDGSAQSYGLNGERGRNELELYTSAVGPTTKTSGGRELILESAGGQWLPLRIGHVYAARIKEVRGRGDTPIPENGLVLSIPPPMADLPVEKGMTLRVSTMTTPVLRGVKTAISGGPVLLLEGRKQKIKPHGESFSSTSMFERHPRTSIGWNDEAIFLVEVDGRQKGLSAGMTLDEMTSYLQKLGCTDGMNLDGGGSAMLWYNGRIRNSPCDGHEREVANSLLITRKAATPKMSSSAR
jgi:hypothetical protein